MKCYFRWLTSSYCELTRKPTRKQKSPHELLFASRVFSSPFLELVLRSSAHALTNWLPVWGKALDWIDFLIWHVSPSNTEYSYALIFSNHLFWKFYGYFSIISLSKKNIFQNKKKTMLGWVQKRIQIMKQLIKYPNCVARRQISRFLLLVTWPWVWHDDVIFRVIGLQKLETDQNNAKFSQISQLLHR